MTPGLTCDEYVRPGARGLKPARSIPGACSTQPSAGFSDLSTGGRRETGMRRPDRRNATDFVPISTDRTLLYKRETQLFLEVIDQLEAI